MSRLRILVVGYGLMGRRRLAAVARLAPLLSVQVAGVVEPASEAPPDLPCWRAAAEVPADAYDAALVCVPHDAEPQIHPEKFVFWEKPGAADSLALCRRKEGPLDCFGYNYRFLPHVARLVEEAQSGRLGELYSADILIGHGGNPDDRTSWKSHPERNGGVLLDLGVHAFDLLRQLDGGVRVEHARVSGGFWGDIDDDAAVTLGGARRFFATARASTTCWASTFRFEVRGSDGYAVADGRGGHYGPMTLRLGRRWGWKDGKSQRDTEEVLHCGVEDRSVEEETEAVIRRWLGEEVARRPAGRSCAYAALRLADAARRKAKGRAA